MHEAAPNLTLCSSANWSILLPRIMRAIEDNAGIRVALNSPPFGQYRALLADPDSELSRSSSDCYIFAERYEDFLLPFETADRFTADAGLERCRDYLQTIRGARSRLAGTFIIHDLAPVRPFLATVREMAGQSQGLFSAIQVLNHEIAQLASDIPDTIVLPVSAVVQEIGRRSADPGKYWLAGRVPFSSQFADLYGRILGGILLARAGKTVRALAVDLDNTLWGGVVGDDGISGLVCGSDFPDNRFLVVQEFLRGLKRRGIVLTLLSKNSESVALSAIEQHAGMVLRKADFTASRVCWNPKSQGLREVAEELGLGEGSFMLIDDNPVERDEVRRSVPEARVPELPTEVADWPAVLFLHPALTALDITQEDLGRERAYAIRQAIRAESVGKTREEFLDSLEMTLSVEPMQETTARRVAQLFAKTNQFNTTVRRYSEGELRELQAQGHDVLSVRLKDRFGSNEIIGALCVTYDDDTASIDGFVLSCRILGRGVDTGVLSAVTERAASRGARSLLGSIVVSPRNEPCREVFAAHGFESVGEGRFIYRLEKGTLAWPNWLRRRSA